MEVEVPLVSVVVPTYNYGRYIQECVRSVLAQRLEDWELIIVDNGSTDETVQRIKPLIDREPRARYVFQEHNDNWVVGLNRGVRLARGKYVKILPADDRLEVDALLLAVDLLERFPNVAFVYSYVHVVDEAGKILGLRGSKKQKSWEPIPGMKQLMSLTSSNYIYFPSVTIRLSSLKEIGDFDEAFLQLTDWDMWMRLSLKYHAAFIPKPLCRYRVHSQSLTSTQPELLKQEQALGVVKKLFHRGDVPRMIIKKRHLILARRYWLLSGISRRSEYRLKAIRHALALAALQPWMLPELFCRFLRYNSLKGFRRLRKLFQEV